MLTISTERIRNTRKDLRKVTLETILNQFDTEIMQLTKEQRQAKYSKMAESAFRFFRGSGYLFYYDVTKIPFPYHTLQNYPVWIQGDLHFENFGAFQNEKGEIVFDVNDFDEGYLGSYLYDVLRMIVSIALVSTDKQFSSEVKEKAILAYLKAYYKQMVRFASEKDDPFTLTFTKENTKEPIRKLLKKLKQQKENNLLAEFTTLSNDQRYFSESEELIPATEEERKAIFKAWSDYLESIDRADRKDDNVYRIKDIAVKYGTGTASIGLKRFYILVEGQSEMEHVDDLILEMKEVRAPIPAYFLPYNDEFWRRYAHQGKRVIETQKAMHHLEDPYLGFMTINETQYYVRERSPYKKKIKLTKIIAPEDLYQTVKLMGKITAKIHARADEDVNKALMNYESEKMIIRAIGDDFDGFAKQLLHYALMYEEQVQMDYELFLQWLKK